MIVLKVAGLLTFSPINYSVGVGIGNFKPAIEVLPLLVGIIHYFTNRKVLSLFIKGLLKREVPKEDAEAIKRGKIEGLKKRYSKKSTAELKIMAENKSLVPEAQKAARELLTKNNPENSY